jgi:hypothetical protein
MAKQSGTFYLTTLLTAILSTGFLLFNMVAIVRYRQQVFFERGTLSAIELLMMFGFGLVLLFNLISILWLLSRLRPPGHPNRRDIAIITLGVVCLFLLAGQKVMVDEIGRELLLGWEIRGEWIILYAMLITQLIYNLIVLLRLVRTAHPRHLVGL